MILIWVFIHQTAVSNLRGCTCPVWSTRAIHADIWRLIPRRPWLSGLQQFSQTVNSCPWHHQKFYTTEREGVKDVWKNGKGRMAISMLYFSTQRLRTQILISSYFVFHLRFHMWRLKKESFVFGYSISSSSSSSLSKSKSSCVPASGSASPRQNWPKSFEMCVPTHKHNKTVHLCTKRWIETGAQQRLHGVFCNSPYQPMLTPRVVEYFEYVKNAAHLS